MKFQIDTKLKTIKVEESVLINELLETLEKFLPDWEEYKLETNTIINWGGITYIPYQPYTTWPFWHSGTSILTTGTSNGTTYNSGSVYNVDTTQSLVGSCG